MVRGTTSLADALTDLSGHLVPFGGCGAEGDVLKGNAGHDSNSPAGSDSSDHGSQDSSAAASSVGTGGSGSSARGSGRGQDDSSSGRGAGDSEGMAHHGILKAAQSLLREQGDSLGQLLRDNPGYRLKVGSPAAVLQVAC